MRISDWSSDVCSSDLDDALSRSPQPRPQIRGVADLLDSLIASEGTGAHAHVRSGALSSGLHAMRNLAAAVHFLCLVHGDRESVVEGKSVSVRGDVGGDGIIEKTKKGDHNRGQT